MSFKVQSLFLGPAEFIGTMSVPTLPNDKFWYSMLILMLVMVIVRETTVINYEGIMTMAMTMKVMKVMAVMAVRFEDGTD